MPTHTLSLSPALDEEIQTERLRIRPLEQSCASLIWQAFKETDGFKAKNGEFSYYADSPIHNVVKNIETQQEGLKFVWNTLLSDIKYRRQEAIFLGLHSGQEKELVGILVAHFDKRKWLEIAPFIFPNHQKNGYGREALEGVGNYLGRTFNDVLIYATIKPSNESSIALFRSLGFHDVEPTRDNVHVKHHRRDIMSLGSREAFCRNFSCS